MITFLYPYICDWFNMIIFVIFAYLQLVQQDHFCYIFISIIGSTLLLLLYLYTCDWFNIVIFCYIYNWFNTITFLISLYLWLVQHNHFCYILISTICSTRLLLLYSYICNWFNMIAFLYSHIYNWFNKTTFVLFLYL